jgi:hypothetical protein
VYVCEISPVTLKEDLRLNVFEYRALKGTFAFKRDEVRLHAGENCRPYDDNLCTSCSPNTIRIIS